MRLVVLMCPNRRTTFKDPSIWFPLYSVVLMHFELPRRGRALYKGQITCIYIVHDVRGFTLFCPSGLLSMTSFWEPSVTTWWSYRPWTRGRPTSARLLPTLGLFRPKCRESHRELLLVHTMSYIHTYIPTKQGHRKGGGSSDAKVSCQEFFL